MRAGLPCPRTPELEELLQRPASPEEAAFLAGHLNECPACADALERTLAGDGLVDAVRRGAAARRPAEESVVERLIGRLRAQGPGLTPTVEERQLAAEEAEGRDLLSPALAPGELGRVGPYRVLRVLGRGGMGMVFEGEDTRLERRVALKVMRPELAPSPEARERFLREARAAASLQHDHVVVIHDVGQDRGLPYLAMQLLRGQSLEERLGEGRPLPVAEVLRIGRQVAEGLAAAHAAGIVHRDIKPANLWLQPGGRLKILDFGLARAALEEVRLTRTGAVAGTPAYMSPEQARGRRADERSDLFSLGCVLYQLCTGQPPFSGADTLAVLKAVTRHQPRPPHALNPEVPPGLSGLVMRLLEKDPARRPASAREVGDALDALERRREPSRPQARPRRRRLVAAAVLLLALLGGAGWWLASALRPADTVRIETPRGVVVIQSVDPAVVIEIRQGGRVVAILDPKSGQKVELDTGDYTVSLAGGPKGLKIDMPERFTLRRDQTVIVRVRRVPTPEKVGEVRRFEGHTEAVHAVAISPDGRIAASGGGGDASGGGTDHAVRLWDVKTGKELHRFKGHTSAVTSVGFSPDGRRLVSAAGGPDATIRIWDVVERKQLACLRGHRPGQNRLMATFSPDGRRILSSSWDGTLHLWDAATGKEVWRIRKLGWDQTAFFPDGRRAVCGGWNGIVILDTETGKELRRFDEAGKGYRWLYVAVSPDGRHVLSSGLGSPWQVQLWDVETGKAVWSPKAYSSGVAFSPDGRRALTATTAPDGSDPILRLWDVGTGELVHRFAGHTAPILNVAYSPDGRYALSASMDKTVRLWRLPDPPPPEKVGDVREFRGHTKRVWAVALSPSGAYALSGGDDAVILWDLATGKELRRLGAALPVHCVAFSPDSRLAAVAGADGTLAVWDVAGGTLQRRWKGHTAGVSRVLFSHDGKQLLSGGWDNALRLWDTDAGKLIRAFTGHTAVIEGLAFSPDGRWIASSSQDETVRRWDRASGKEERWFTGHVGHPSKICVSPDGRFLFARSLDGTIRGWDVATGRTALVLRGHVRPVTGLACTPGGLLVAAGTGPTVHVWDVRGGPGTEIARFPGHPHVLSVATSADGRYALGGGDDGILRLWRLPDPPPPEKVGEVRRFEGHTGVVAWVTATADGRYALSAGHDHTLRLWEVATGKEVRRFLGHTSLTWCAALSPDGRRFASASRDGTARVWDLDSGRELVCFRGHSVEVTSVAFTPDGRSVLSGGWEGTVRLWDAASGRERLCLRGHQGSVWCVAICPNGKQAVSVGSDRSVRLWDLAGGRQLFCLTGHGRLSDFVAISPDGKRAVSAGQDGTARIWDLEQGLEVFCFRGHGALVRGVAFSPGGRRVLSAGSDGTLLLWEAESGRILWRGHIPPGTKYAFGSLRFLPDGLHALSACYDGLVRLWRLPAPPL